MNASSSSDLFFMAQVQFSQNLLKIVRWIFLFLLPFGFQCHLLHTDVWGKLKFSDIVKTDRDWQAAMHSVCFMAGERENKDRNEQVLHQNGP